MRKPDFNRLLKVLLREEPDAIPFYEHFVDAEVVEVITGKPITGMLFGSMEYLKTLADFYYKLGYDYVPLELPLNLPRTNVLTTRDTAVLSRGRRTWQDENRGTIETRGDFENYPWPSLGEAVDLSPLEKLAKILPDGMEIVGGVSGGVFEHVSWMMGLTPLSKALYLDRKLVDDMFNKIGRLISEVDEEIAKMDRIGALRMGDDLGYKRGTFIAPQFIRKYVLPWQKKCVEIAHKRGLPFILHSCGNLYRVDETCRSIMDDLVEYVGIDAKHSFEDEIKPVWDIKAEYGEKVAILGGVDMDKLARLPMEELRKYVVEVVARCSPGGGYALGSGNTIANYVRVENYLAMLEEGLKHGKYPK
jgi:uroporphyrinogen decarboxylase